MFLLESLIFTLVLIQPDSNTLNHPILHCLLIMCIPLFSMQLYHSFSNINIKNSSTTKFSKNSFKWTIFFLKCVFLLKTIKRITFLLLPVMSSTQSEEPNIILSLQWLNRMELENYIRLIAESRRYNCSEVSRVKRNTVLGLLALLSILIGWKLELFFF